MSPENNVNTNEKLNTMEKSTITSKKDKKHKLILKFSNVEKKSIMRTIINGCNITLYKGEIMAVLGPEGQGKSTLAKLAAGLIRPSSGEVIIRGIRAGRKTNAVVSYQPDIPYFKYDNTVSELLNMYGRFFKDFSYKRAYKLLKHFNISRRTKFEDLSTTALFIVQVIMASSRKAGLYIFDDPLVHCDPKYRDEIIKMINPCRKNGAVLLFSQIAGGLDDITDKVAFIKHGEIIKEFYDADSYEAEYGNKLLNDVYKEVFKRA